MVDIPLIEKRGGSIEELRKKFTAETPDSKIKELVDLNAYRIDDGINQNLHNARLWYAIDRAFDVSERQVTHTLVEGMLDAGMNGESVMDAMKTWGISHQLNGMLSPLTDSDGNAKRDSQGRELMKLDLPTFFNIFVPLVAAYVKIRWSKLFGDRDIYPLYKYEPVAQTTENRLRCEIITSRIQRMAQEMGYREDERQSILQMLKYGVCLNFPSEPFHKEKQLYLEASGEVERVVKEGVRFEIPHPSRVFYDLNSRLSTANTDTGTEYAGYWDVIRYKDVKNNKELWNTGDIQFKYGSWVDKIAAVWRELSPCSMRHFPTPSSSSSQSGDNERTKEAYRYSQHHLDQGVTRVCMFQKLVPSEWNLFNYDNPVWMRFIHAGSHTVCHATPLAYCPLVAYLYDADLGKARQSSLALELLPFQDQLSNLLSQYILTVKQNLGRAVFWNTDQVDQKDIDAVKNLGEKQYRGTVWIPYSKRELSWQQGSEREAFTPLQFPKGDSVEIAGAIAQLLSMMERVLGYSAQEVGVPATHEQTAQEVQIIALNTSNRLELTGSFIDSAIKARKKLLYEAFMAYSDDEVMADVAEVDDTKEAKLKSLGFTVDDPESRGAKAGIRGAKSSLRIDGFSSDREGADRVVDAKLAAVMVQTFQSIFANPVLAQAAGLDQLVDLFNQVLVYSGAPKDFRIKIEKPAQQGGTPEQQAQAQQQQMESVQQQVAAIASQVADAKLTEAGGAIKQAIDQSVGSVRQETAAAVQQLATRQSQQQQLIQRLVAIISQAQQPTNAQPTEAPAPGGGYPVTQGMAVQPAVPTPQAMPVG